MTLPLLAPTIRVSIFLSVIGAIQLFDMVYVLTGGGPANTTETLTVYAYRSLFQTLQLGFGSAIGVVIFVLVMAVAAGYLRALRREGLAA